jgi:hypothetical protein
MTALRVLLLLQILSCVCMTSPSTETIDVGIRARCGRYVAASFHVAPQFFEPNQLSVVDQ